MLERCDIAISVVGSEVFYLKNKKYISLIFNNDYYRTKITQFYVRTN